MALNNGTKETCAWHIWEHDVVTEAIKGGAELDGIKAMSHRLHAAYNAGEPIWMMVSELIDQCKGYGIWKAVSEEPERMRDFLRASIKD